MQTTKTHKMATLFILAAIFFLGSLRARALTVELVEVATGLTDPIYVTGSGDGTGRLFVLQQRGRIRIISGGTLLPNDFLNVGVGGLDLVSTSGDEQGLLGLAFDPRHNGVFYISYTRKSDGDNIVSRFTVSANPDVANTTEEIILGPVDQPQANHNGGMIVFGPDNLLYMGIGDGGGGGDTGTGHTTDLGNAQDLTKLLGKILRIDVINPPNGQPYGIPEDNPYANGAGGARPEIYAYGVRNPWRFSFDRADGTFYLGDVGQLLYEEVDIVTLGGNYGWRRMEGLHCYTPNTDCQTGSLILPILEYSHSEGCSITGGHVYRGSQFPSLFGKYIFGDHCQRRIWMMGAGGTKTLLATSPLRLPSFGEGDDGEIYLCGYTNPSGQALGKIFHLVDTDVQLTPTPTSTPGNGRAVGDFNNTGCTDLNDFLFLLDNWQTLIDGTLLDLPDFLALLDNWLSGASC